MRKCGDCQLCCRLVPVKSLGKKASQRCVHQKHGKGCSIYARLPIDCRLWSCAWLLGKDTQDLRRPDRSRYVIDCMPEYIKVAENGTGIVHKVPCVQVWIDPRSPDAHEDPALRRFLARRGEEGITGLMRMNAHDGFVIWPPAMTSDGQWHIQTGESEAEHSAEEVFNALVQGDSHA